ncbi:MAG: DUF3046 domain-containing protein [Nocardioidaceae bacterium]|nr:MAG: DUF3046 domain-containing protein [Nocardioidaceae bacterium]
MRHSELRERLETTLGTGYARVWTSTQVISGLGHRTVEEALAAGTDPKLVWRAVVEALELPASER